MTESDVLLAGGMSYEEYDRILAVRWTVLRWMANSPAAYLEALVGSGQGETKALRLGRAIHCALLEPGVYPAKWVTWTGKARSGKKWDAFKAENFGREILTGAESASVVAAVAAIRRHRVARLYLDGACEQVAVWVDRPTGLKCKSRSDIVGPMKYVEIKTTLATVEPVRFGMLAARMQYDAGIAFHLDGMRQAGAEVDDEPLIIAVEAKPPYDCVVFRVPMAIVWRGRNEYRRLLDRLAECIEAERQEALGGKSQSTLWPGHAPDHVVDLEYPEWAFRDPDAHPFGLDVTGLETE